MNKLTVIGSIAEKRCYLNMDKKNAIKLYNEVEDASVEVEGISVEEFEFEDEFKVYDVWPSECGSSLKTKESLNDPENSMQCMKMIEDFNSTE